MLVYGNEKKEAAIAIVAFMFSVSHIQKLYPPKISTIMEIIVL